MSQPVFPLEELPPNDPLRAVLGGAALLELNTVARLVHNSVFVIALYNTPASRQTLIEHITRQSDPTPNIIFSFDAEHLDAQDYLGQIPAQERGQRHIIHFCDIENVLEEAAPRMDLARDRLSQRPHMLILWLPNSARAPFARLAPNLFSRHSGVFDLRLGAAAEGQAPYRAQKQAWDSFGINYTDLEDWERLHSLYEKLLKEHESDPSALPETLAELHLRLGRLDYARSNDNLADAHFQQARQLLSEKSPPGLRAEALYYVGQMDYRLHNRYEAALESYNAALILSQTIGHHLGEATARKAIGDVQQFRKEMDAALESYNAALKLYQTAGDRLGEANVLQAIGDVQQFRADRDSALENYNAALKLFRDGGDRMGEANALHAIGDVQQFRRELDAALESYRAALKLFKAVGATLGEANTLDAIGDVQRFRKEMAPALESYIQALKLHQIIGDRLGEANALESIGNVQQFYKKTGAALECYNAALKLYQTIGETVGEANTRKAIGDVHNFRKEMDAALESYNQVLKLCQVTGDRLGEANALDAIGDVHQFRKETDAALESYNTALTLFRAIGEKVGEANELAALSRIVIQKGDIQEAEKQMAQAITIRRTIGSLYEEGVDYGNFALALLNHGHKDKAKEYALKARAIFEKINLPANIKMTDQIIAAADAPDQEAQA